MHLIYLLAQTGVVTVSYTSSDLILFKAAGAANCATGKFFNLRRFTSSRFDDSEQGGGQIPYWFEPNLLGFLRENDVLRLKRQRLDSMFADMGTGSIWTAHIGQNLAQSPPQAWLAESWRQYLSSFGKIEKRVAGIQDIPTVAGWLKDAEARWKQLDERGIIMDEERNPLGPPLATGVTGVPIANRGNLTSGDPNFRIATMLRERIESSPSASPL
jgi:hypothetical protein